MKINQLMVVIVVGILSQCNDAESGPMQKFNDAEMQKSIIKEGPSKVKPL